MNVTNFYFITFGNNRLWQDAENRNILTSLLMKNSAQVLFSTVLAFLFLVLNGCHQAEKVMQVI